ncbi:MAG: protein translocase subunit SecF [Armatimonadota bacterium]
MDFFRKQNWDIMKYTWLWFTISGILILSGMGFWAVRGLNWGIDFTGGSLLQYEFERPLVTEPGEEIAVIEQTREMLEQMGLGRSQIQVADDNQLFLRTPEVENDEEARERDQAIEGRLAEIFGDRGGEISSLGRQTVGPVIGEMLTRSAIEALALGVVLILIYITVRYEFRFAVSAVIALLHDTALLLGALAMLQTELNSWLVAAILTVIGYSINDTVIILDRIRENRGLHRRAPLDSVVNASLLQTMARSINTGVTTLFTLIALFLFGGATIEGFALALIIGVAAGGYSSIFTASPVVVTWYDIADRRKSRGREPARRKKTGAASKAAVSAASAAEEQADESDETRPTMRETMKEAERAAQEEKRRKRRERRKKRDDRKSGRQPKKRF